MTYVSGGLLAEATKVLAGSGLSVEQATGLASGPRPPAGDQLGAALADGWSTAERAEATDPTLTPGTAPATMVSAFDLGARLRARATGRPQPRLLATPFRASGPLVAVTVQRVGDRHVVSVRRPGRPAVTEVGTAGLDALLPPAGTDTWETIVVPDRATLTALTTLAAPAAPGTTADRAGALADWWTQRSQHPGTGAVLVATDACTTRWVTGAGSTAERALPTWTDWLGVTGQGTAALLGVAARLTAGPALTIRGMDSEDAYAWKWFTGPTTWDWRRPDSPKIAALGLASRNTAASVWARTLLDDPAWTSRERYAGRAMVATLTAAGDQLRVTTIDGVCRFRPGDRTVVAVTTPTGPGAIRARVSDVSVRPDGGVTLTLTVVRTERDAAARAATATTAVVRPEDAAVTANLAFTTRRAIAKAYGAEGTWVASRNRPAPRIRRDVPLSVILAGAAD